MEHGPEGRPTISSTLQGRPNYRLLPLLLLPLVSSCEGPPETGKKNGKIPPPLRPCRAAFRKTQRNVFRGREHTLNIHHNLGLAVPAAPPLSYLVDRREILPPTLPPFCLLGPHLATFRCVFSLVPISFCVCACWCPLVPPSSAHPPAGRTKSAAHLNSLIPHKMLIQADRPSDL